MSVEYAVLGLLSIQPMAGYDIKKILQDAPFLPWSGNNNQVYKALTALLNDGYVTNEVLHQDSLPSKKVYAIADAGRAALRRWMCETPDAAEMRKPFLVRLAWAGEMDRATLLSMLDAYERQVQGEQAIHRNAARRFVPGRNALDVALWRLIDENIDDAYTTELRWIARAREQLAAIAQDALLPPTAQSQQTSQSTQNKNEGEANPMRYTLVERGQYRYIHYTAQEAPELTLSGVHQLIVDCVENQANLILFDAGALPQDFYRLRTGIAGEMLQKFAQYRIQAALLLPKADMPMGAFRDMMAEANRGQMFRSFEDIGQAERWLARQGEVL